MAKLTKQQWADARKVWELDPREGHQWLADDLVGKGFDVNRVAIAKAAKRQGWAKVTQGEKVTESVTPKVTQVEKKSLKKVTEPKAKSIAVIAKAEPEDDEDDGERLHGNSLYKQEYEEQVYKLCLLGATDAEIADFFDVTERTINNWKADYPGFFHSIKRGKIISDAEVADKLFKRATGYSHPETHVSNYQGEITLTELTKHYPPDTGAAFIWLKNRRSGQWKDKVEVSNNIKIDKELLNFIETEGIKRLEDARKRQHAVLVERGLIVDGEFEEI